MFRHLLVLLSISLASCGQNISKKIVENKSDHYLVHTYGWQALSGLGVVGTILNSFLLHTFFIERKGMATSVNAMICFDTLHRMIYSAISIHWRTYNMIYEEPLFYQWLGKYQVLVIIRKTKCKLTNLIGNRFALNAQFARSVRLSQSHNQQTN